MTNKKTTMRSTNGSRKNNKKDVVKSKNTAKKNVVNPRVLGRMLADLWEIPHVSFRNDDYIIRAVTGQLPNSDMSKWPPLMIQKARTVSNIDTKIKIGKTIKSELDVVREFVDTQKDPLVSKNFIKMLSDSIDSIFCDFDYEAVLKDVNDPFRTRSVTNGSASPQLLAPVSYWKDQGVLKSNAETLAAMAVGDQLFDKEFDSRHVFEWVADGKIKIVPKNYKNGRMITIASRERIDQQAVVSIALRDYITQWSKTSNHIIQFDDQSVQWSLLKEGYATIDLSSASDRVYMKLLEKAWPTFTKHFGHLLPKTVMFQGEKNWLIDLKCAGTQGFPLTFTLMAIVAGLMVFAIKTNTLPSSKYGDDFIVSEEDFEEACCALESIGFKINKDKTHTSSSGFLESCGMDVMFTRHGRREITPIYLRGTSHVEVIQFFHQLCYGALINPNDAISIMDRLGVEYYAFEYAYQLTEFHFPHGDIKNVPRAQWSSSLSCYTCNVPAIKSEVDSIRGLSKKESAIVMELLHIESMMKNPSIHTKTIRGTDPIARPYGLYDLQDNRLFDLYKRLSEADSQVLVNLRVLENEFKITFKALAYYHFITSEMVKYKYSTPTVDFSDFRTKEFTLGEFIESEFGINSEQKFPIYNYRNQRSSKSIVHPKSNLILGVDNITSV